MLSSFETIWGKEGVLVLLVGLALIFEHKPYFAEDRWGHLCLTIVLIVFPYILGTIAYNWKRLRGEVPYMFAVYIATVYLLVAHFLIIGGEGVMKALRS